MVKMKVRKISTTKVLIPLILTILIFPSLVWSATFYIDGSTGNDSNPGSLESPWRSIGKANNTLRAGDTVYIRKGIYYGDYVNPINSGTSDTTRITYSNYSNESVKIQDAAYGIRLNGKSYVTVRGLVFYNLDHFLYIENNANRNVIEQCSFDKMRNYTWGGSRIWNNSKYNVIRNCTLSRYGYADTGDYGVLLEVGNWSLSNDYSDYNLIENSTFFSGGHHLLGIAGKYNAVRNNYFHHEAWTACLRTTGKCGNRCLYTEGAGAQRNLFEGNRFAYGGLPADDYGAVGFQISSPFNIIRRNVSCNNGASGFYLSTSNGYARDVSYNYIYNNTSYRDGYLSGAPESAKRGISFCRWGGPVITNNIIKNNILYKNCYNGFGYASASADAQTFANNWEGTQDPLFVDESGSDPFDSGKPDLRLKAGSKCIDGGAWLTTVTSASGSGVKFSVGNAGYFMDGWGIIKGDKIQLQGQSTPVDIVSVDYATHTITVSKSITWATGNGVSLAFSGSAPDIGAYESSSTTLPQPGGDSDTGYSNIEAETGILTAPMQVVSNIQASGGSCIMSDTDNLGAAVFNFYVGETGSYKIMAKVFALSSGSDSFFIKVDGETEDIWDLCPTGSASEYNAWRDIVVTKRGSGVYEDPYSSYMFNLGKGNHTITFRGREASALLDYFYLVKTEENVLPPKRLRSIRKTG